MNSEETFIYCGMMYPETTKSGLLLLEIIEHQIVNQAEASCAVFWVCQLAASMCDTVARVRVVGCGWTVQDDEADGGSLPR